MITQVYKQGESTLSYCDAEEYYNLRAENKEFSALLCAKNPFHKEVVGYEERNCQKHHPEYLVAYRPEQHLMALNMVDAPKYEFFSNEMVYSGLEFVQSELAQGHNVVVVCNKGESRSATMCLMYLMVHGEFDVDSSHAEVFNAYKTIAPNWNPGNGILQYCINFWTKLREESQS